MNFIEVFFTGGQGLQVSVVAVIHGQNVVKLFKIFRVAKGSGAAVKLVAPFLGMLLHSAVGRFPLVMAGCSGGIDGEALLQAFFRHHGGKNALRCRGAADVAQTYEENRDHVGIENTSCSLQNARRHSVTDGHCRFLKSVVERLLNMHNNRVQELAAKYHLPLFDLLEESHGVLKKHHSKDIQKCSLLSIKTGACPEDCAYCPQSGHYKTDIGTHRVLPFSRVQSSIQAAKDLGAKRFCMGAAWREVRDDEEFEEVLEMVREVKRVGMEACVTLGMLSESQASKLKEAGLDAYNHNLDTGPRFYPKIITTRSYQDRLETLDVVQRAGLSVCSGGILGMGERLEDRLEMLDELLNLEHPPESIPINLLIPVAGTPLEGRPPIDPIELVRFVAITRIFFPNSKVRLSAGRTRLSKEAQLLCYYAGANSIFLGEKLLTMDNPSVEEDLGLIGEL